MLKDKTIELMRENGFDFKNIFSACIGKTFLFQKRFIDYLGHYNNWNTNIKEGILYLDDRAFNVEYIGTTSKADNYWFGSETEDMIPDDYIELMLNIKEKMRNLNIPDEVGGARIPLTDEITGYNLSMIYIAFASENVAYFCGSGDVSLYMFVKNLPEDIFKQLTSVEFSTVIMGIISSFKVNHKLLVEALLLENDIEYEINENKIIAKFSETSILTVQFDDNNLISNISGNL